MEASVNNGTDDFDPALLYGAVVAECARRYQPITRDPSYTLDDYVQDTYLSAWAMVRRGRRLGREMVARVASSTLIDVLRSRGGRRRNGTARPGRLSVAPAISDDAVAVELSGACVDLSGWEELWDVLRVLRTLPHRERDLCLRALLLDEPMDAIAARIGVCPSRVSQIVSRARGRLLERMEAYNAVS